MTSREEFLDREASAWAAFETQVDRVAAEDRERPGALEGWSVKDVVWHCAYWASFGADAIEGAGEGRFQDPFDAEPDEYWDQVNAEIAAESSRMSWEAVRTGTDEARERVRSLAGAEGVAPEVLEWAADETYVHYDEHADHLRAFADSLD